MVIKLEIFGYIARNLWLYCQTPSNLHSSPKCWHDISNIIYIQLTYTPQIVGIIYPIHIYILKMSIPQPCAQRVHRNLHSSPKCWHDISNIIYIQLTYTPQIVGIIYPIQIYILKNVNSPTLCPKGTQKPSNLHSSPKCWHDISNIIYIL